MVGFYSANVVKSVGQEYYFDSKLVPEKNSVPYNTLRNSGKIHSETAPNNPNSSQSCEMTCASLARLLV